MDDTSKKVAERFQDKTVMAVVIRDAPPTYNWGWFSREDRWIHVQTVDRQHIRLHYKARLEDRGARVFIPDKDIPPKVTKELLKAIREQEESVEMEWVHLMIQNRWLTLHPHRLPKHLW